MKRILIIEDDPMISRIYQNKFKAEGFDAQVANDGEKAIQAAGEFTPDAVLLDLQLPKVNGVEVLKHLRSKTETKKVPVIVFSNSYLSTLVQQAWQAGANKVLTKADCTPRQLVDIIRAALANPASATAFPNPIKPPVSDTPLATAYSTPSTSGAGPGPTAAAPVPDLQPEPVRAVPAPEQNTTEADADFQQQVRQMFLQTLPGILQALRSKVSVLSKGSPETRLPDLYEFYRTVHSLAGNAGIAGFSRMANMSSAFEALLKELYEKPKSINTSSLRTVAHAVDLLAALYESAMHPKPESPMPPVSLVIDDETSSNWTVCSSLEIANLRAVSIDDSSLALKLLEQNRFDLIFLDIDMPGINGFDLCAKIRNLPTNKTTPVIFVTGLTDMESRGRSALAGGNDLIMKPFLPIELAVKALTYLLRNQVK
jgi:DNA-binding response OmpR family regulator